MVLPCNWASVCEVRTRNRPRFLRRLQAPIDAKERKHRRLGWGDTVFQIEVIQLHVYLWFTFVQCRKRWRNFHVITETQTETWVRAKNVRNAKQCLCKQSKTKESQGRRFTQTNNLPNNLNTQENLYEVFLIQNVSVKAIQKPVHSIAK